jgi:hypothetical protein
LIKIDNLLLKDTIQEKGYKLKYIAEQMGLSSYGLGLKLSGVQEFKVSEINKIIVLLSLSKNEIENIFFEDLVHLK